MKKDNLKVIDPLEKETDLIIIIDEIYKAKKDLEKAVLLQSDMLDDYNFKGGIEGENGFKWKIGA